jgi:hypothetical protein
MPRLVEQDESLDPGDVGLLTALRQPRQAFVTCSKNRVYAGICVAGDFSGLYAHVWKDCGIERTPLLHTATLDRVDDLMVLQYQYDEGAFEVLYHGPIGLAVQVARAWKDRYELDLAKARQLQLSRTRSPELAAQRAPEADEAAREPLV